MDDIHLPHQLVLKDAEAHLHPATQERSYYRSVIDTCKEVMKETFTVNGQLQVPSIDARLLSVTFNIIMYFSIDMAQQVCCSFIVHSTIKINAHVLI